MSRDIVIVSDAPPSEGLQRNEPEGFTLHWYVCVERDDPDDFQDVLDLCRKTRAIGLVAGSASALPLVTWVGESLGLLGISVQVAQLMSDRGLLLERLRAAGIPTIPFRAAGDEDEAVRAAHVLGEPVVVQAVEAAEGARSRYVQHLPEVGLAYRQVTKYSRSKRVLVTHPAGEVRHSVFCHVHKGDVRIAAVADVRVDPRFQFPDRLTVPAALDAVSAAAHADLALRIVNAIRITNGCLRLDLVESPGGLMISGVDMCVLSDWLPWDLLRLAGMAELYEDVLRISAGEAPKAVQPATKVGAIVWLHCPTGEVIGIDGVATAEAMPGVEAVCVRIEKGDIIRHIVDQAGRDRIGFAVLHASNMESCDELAQRVVTAVTIRTRTAYDSESASEGG